MSLKAIVVSVIAFAACSSSPTPKATEAKVTEEGTPRALRYDTVQAGKPFNLAVSLQDNVSKACHIPAGETFFPTNSDALDAQDKTIIDMVAGCMKTGPLKDKQILLTGFADYTGEYAYNKDLSLQRSKSVADELVRLGVPADRIFIRSYGERGASYPGNGALDRKVELRLVAAQSI